MLFVDLLFTEVANPECDNTRYIYRYGEFTLSITFFVTGVKNGF